MQTALSVYECGAVKKFHGEFYSECPGDSHVDVDLGPNVSGNGDVRGRGGPRGFRAPAERPIRPVPGLSWRNATSTKGARKLSMAPVGMDVCDSTKLVMRSWSKPSIDSISPMISRSQVC